MKYIPIILLSCAVCSGSVCHAQAVFSLTSAGQAYGKAIACDSWGNFIVAALFDNSLDCDPDPAGTVTLTSNGLIDILVAKYSREGDLLWGMSVGGATTLDAPHAVAADRSGNIYIAGYFGMEGQGPRSVDFDPSPAGQEILTTEGGFDAFLAKYDAAGNCQWALPLGAQGAVTEDRAWDVALDSIGNVYITGAFSGTVDFNPMGSANLITAAGSGFSLFLAKYDTNGNNLWAFGIPAGLIDVFSEGYSAVSVDINDTCYLSGNFRGTNVDFDPSAGGAALLTSAGLTDMFLASYMADSTINWAIRLGGAAQDIVSPSAMRTGPDQQVYLTGHFRGTADFDPRPANTYYLTCPGTDDNLFVASYNDLGALRWAFNASSSVGLDGGHRVGFDLQGNVYVTGWFQGTADFNPSVMMEYNMTAHGTGGAGDIFLAKYTNSGGFLWAFQIGAAITGSGNLSIGAGLATDSIGNAVITGKFYGTNVDFDPSLAQLLLSNLGTNAAFAAKYNPAGLLWLDDPPTGNDEYTVLLVQSEHPDGSQTFADSSAGATEPHPLTVTGDTRHETDEHRFGASAMAFDGNGDYLSAPASADWEFGAGDFTVDFWMYVRGTASYMGIFALGRNSNPDWRQFNIELTAGGAVRWHIQQNSGYVINLYSPSAVQLNRWIHVAAVRYGTEFSLYLDGRLVAASSSSASLAVYSDPLVIGRRPEFAAFNGYLEEVRVSKGIARWITDFPPPLAPYAQTTPTPTPSPRPSVTPTPTATPPATPTPAPLPATGIWGMGLLVLSITWLFFQRHNGNKLSGM